MTSTSTYLIVYVIGGLIFLITFLMLSKYIRPNRPNVEKNATYESGEAPQGGAWVQFHLRYYMLAILFLLFEIEIIFLFPWAAVFSDRELNNYTMGDWGRLTFFEIVIFILVLAIGLAYVWRNGVLDSVRPKEQKIKFRSSVPAEMYDKINQRYESQK